ncbi:alpha/beta hydrolase [Limobrevibacterium gyesilva]|uniref:Prolyl oligopeptidase family serine peptidase n=1 Tax=Limobrevibacterium gyesilva TaxID=2991712 RepID=A0AA41YKR4_9PROT|nr:prolyl oligopeptidase family serine peptidase [Limobrevibacterium gyesilva]MCW3474176.1 prolyl oligopeptidase family serine peptidase [Limobrevibacterium gyesilva]
MAELDGPRWGPKDGAARQLVVLCHGVGADGHDLIDLAPHWAPALPHAAFAAPDGPEPYDMAPFGRQWFSLTDRTPARVAAGVAAAAGPLDRFIDAELLRLGLPPDAYALMGFSQGAMAVLFTGLRRATPPRAILAYSGALVSPVPELPGRPPVLLVHGEADQVVPAERSRLAESALQAAGFPVEALYCPRLGHGIDEAGLSTGSLFLQRVFSAG